MFIESIQLNNFRNYETLQVEFDRGTNILYGDNGEGNKKIVETVYLRGTSKHDKVRKDK